MHAYENEFVYKLKTNRMEIEVQKHYDDNRFIWTAM